MFTMAASLFVLVLISISIDVFAYSIIKPATHQATPSFPSHQRYKTSHNHNYIYYINDDSNKADFIISSARHAGSPGVEAAIDYLNKKSSFPLVRSLVITDKTLNDEVNRANMWTGGSFIIESATIKGIQKQGMNVELSCLIKGKKVSRTISSIPFLPDCPEINDEEDLKIALIIMAYKQKMYKETGELSSLPFGKSYFLPKDFRFNDVPHAGWVRAYLYNAAGRLWLTFILIDTLIITFFF